jgi:iron complex transport system substrate-binding protein
MRRFTALAAASAVAVLLAACSSSPGTSSAGAAHDGVFPVTVSSSTGAVTITARPTHIVSLSASATSMLYDIGAGRQVVAVDKYSQDPPSAPRTGLTGFETDAESYLTYHPDLVVLAQDPGGTLSRQLAAAGVPTVVLTAATSVADTYSQITTLGKATGHEFRAATENASIKSQLAAIVRAAGTRGHGVTYYYELDPTLYTTTSQTFIGSLYKMLGMVNVADPAGAGGNDYPQLSSEFLLHADPQYIFLADGQCCGQSATTVATRPGFATVRAVQEHHVFAVADSIASEWGPRIVQLLQLIARDIGAPTR